VSDATFIWNGGTGSYNDPANWTLTAGSVPNTPNTPLPDDQVIVPPNSSPNDIQLTDTFLGPTMFQSGQIDITATGDDTAGVDVAGTVIATNTIATSMIITSSGDTINNGTIIADANATLAFDVIATHAHNAGVFEATNGGTLIFNSTGTATFGNASTVIADGGLVTINAALATDHIGAWRLTNAATIEVNTAVTNEQTFDFVDGNNDVVKLTQLANFQGILAEMGSGDIVDLGAVNVGTIIYDGSQLTLEDGSGTALGILNAPNIFDINGIPINSGTFTVGSDGSADGLLFTLGTGGDLLMTPGAVACFAKGTRVSTEHGSQPIEDLREGDMVLTALDGAVLPVRWIGHRVIDCTRHPEPRHVWPIRIMAGAFGRGTPARDLWLSPNHAVYADGVLIPVKHLVNDLTIIQQPLDEVTYYHIELPRHDVVLAEGLPAESYLPGADRSVFANAGGPIALHPDLASLVWEAEGCAPLVVTGATLSAVRARLAGIARRGARRRTTQAA
jgi:hypothetical protein